MVNLSVLSPGAATFEIWENIFDWLADGDEVVLVVKGGPSFDELEKNGKLSSSGLLRVGRPAASPHVTAAAAAVGNGP